MTRVIKKGNSGMQKAGLFCGIWLYSRYFYLGA
ncbi:hypothetical protein kac65v162_gp114 [Nodularia phage vB_NspS-kac65v162]|uniref:Uncharacterized protein n=5 Tax=Ravarandavirus TaxID=2843444 RepID=A0A482MKZ5_9CAUD|nr:hypothetical protein HWC12_gp203 [Nodularia phage vB_NspS-kac65v151]YP_009844925.1 hypothetical protein HWC13_gp195 [Nodularia phage vB_NspS-kac68v161]QBQ73352.1 hypothetical protein kac65v161_gp114 [Nodularia phage vB_NspS-kac65v161]QBQ73558.1 hypothetical protein kac65v162_gp114 [Nodularia phage vB_NspS-kac65v162]QBQ73962.1 hypothetical protein kac68v162_gp114 [Nodularia phage vB_NspS-kac68v162]QBQ73144.1 hypothetical protein kac65v151_gp114 [Nodularia phage vB_NspS-kac65v151]QBQ73766.1 